MSRIKVLKIYDPALCCNTGVCGTEPDQALLNFAANVEWLKEKGVTVERYNLAQQPMEYANNDTVKSMLQERGLQALPLIMVDDKVVLSGRYPDRQEMELWVNFGAVPIQPSGGCCCCG